jgi:hypothetical protein
MNAIASSNAKPTQHQKTFFSPGDFGLATELDSLVSI